MADVTKQKKKNKLSFIMDEEEGEISDSSDCEIEVKRKRDLAFINEWSEKVKQQKSESQEECTMDLESDTEESKIDVKPIAMTITFRDEHFSRKHRGVVETQMVMKYGPENVDSNSHCIFVSPSKSSKDISNNVIVPLGAMTIVFHDEDFNTDNYDYILNFCKELFGSSKVTSDKFVIEVVQNDLLDFDVDTSQFGTDDILYVKPSDGCIQEENSKTNRRPYIAAICFNCGGNHNLNSCRENRNYAIIYMNREKFKAQKMKSNLRYHAETDKFSGFAPGYISKNLRYALGLKSNQLPRHIYNMRKYGYPISWLLEAKVAHSGVSVYGSKGAVPEDGDEEGEVFEEGDKDQYDIKKLFEFPGFNTAPPSGTKDEHQHFQCPAINKKDDISEMIRRLAPSAYQAYKKKRAMRLKTTSESNCPNSEIDSPLKTPENIAAPVGEPTPLSVEPETNLTPKQKPRETSINLGTPVLPSSSPFSKLPDRNKFGVNISDVINFENLPNSTGTYEKVANSIAKIRVFVAQNSTE